MSDDRSPTITGTISRSAHAWRQTCSGAPRSPPIVWGAARGLTEHCAGRAGPDVPSATLFRTASPVSSGERLAYLYFSSEVLPTGDRGSRECWLGSCCPCARQAGVVSIWVGSSLTNMAACELWRDRGAMTERPVCGVHVQLT